MDTCYKPDLYVFGGIVVELKAVTDLIGENTKRNSSITCASRASPSAISSISAIEMISNGNDSFFQTSTTDQIVDLLSICLISVD